MCPDKSVTYVWTVQAGLKPGDIITEISGRRISNASDVEQVLGFLGHSPEGDRIFLAADGSQARLWRT